MTDTPEEFIAEFKQYLKKLRLAEKQKNKEEKESVVLKQIENLLGAK